jgi:hypothetical protein
LVKKGYRNIVVFFRTEEVVSCLICNLARKTVLIWIRRPVFCLSLPNKSCGRTADASWLCVTVFTVQMGKKGQRILISLVFVNYRKNFNMLLIIFLGLICKLTSVSGDCDVGIQEVKSFNYNKVGNIMLTRFVKQAVFKISAWFLHVICCLGNVRWIVHIWMLFREYINDYLLMI